MGASSASTQSNTNTISVRHEYTIGRFVCGCFSPYSFSFSFSFLFFFFFLWASLSSFLVASEEALVVPTTTTGIYNTTTTTSSSSSTTSGTAFLSPTPPAKSHLNTSGSSSSKHHSRVDLKIGLVVGVSLFLFFSGVVFVAVIIMGCFPRRFRFVNTRRRHGSEKVVAHEYDEEEEGSNRDSYCKDHGENDCGGIEGSHGTRDVCRTRRRFTWGEVEKFTCNFSSVIGSGGFSTVYLAQFPNSKALAAVKIHCSSSERLNRVFKQEMEILMGLEHDNIVKFLGYCDERGIFLFVGFFFPPNFAFLSETNSSVNQSIFMIHFCYCFRFQRKEEFWCLNTSQAEICRRNSITIREKGDRKTQQLRCCHGKAG